MNWLKRYQYYRKLKLAQERARLTLQVLDTMDMGFINAKMSDKDRLDFFMKLFGDQKYREEVLTRMVTQPMAIYDRMH